MFQNGHNKHSKWYEIVTMNLLLYCTKLSQWISCYAVQNGHNESAAIVYEMVDMNLLPIIRNGHNESIPMWYEMVAMNLLPFDMKLVAMNLLPYGTKWSQCINFHIRNGNNESSPCDMKWSQRINFHMIRNSHNESLHMAQNGHIESSSICKKWSEWITFHTFRNGQNESVSIWYEMVIMNPVQYSTKWLK